jgi:CheY-like chemotaxis protein
MALILIVEDHDDTRRLLQTLLEKWWHEVVGVETGEGGLALLATQKPDIIIVDGMMPGMNGTEFIRLLRASETAATVPAILYTAIADQDFTDNALAKGANEIWIKGQVNAEQMREQIESYLKR